MTVHGVVSRVVLGRLAVGAAVCGAAASAYVLHAPDQPTPIQATATSTIASPALSDRTPSGPNAAPAGPSFDVVRVGPQGSAVLAGRAAPGAMVDVTDGHTSLGQTRADQRGEWVLLPSEPLAPGGRELTVSARTGNEPAVKGADKVLLDVPSPAKSAEPVVALLVPQSGPAHILQGSEAAKPGTRLGLGTVDYDDRGEIRFAGTAPPGAPVRVYVDNKSVGDAVADARGRWTMTPGDAMVAGVHQLRIDQLTPAGKVQARVELPFQRTSIPATELAAGRVVVQPGQNLWRLARRAYGSGVRYTVIYLANRDQIRDPRLIYPGQAFALPKGAP